MKTLFNVFMLISLFFLAGIGCSNSNPNINMLGLKLAALGLGNGQRDLIPLASAEDNFSFNGTCTKEITFIEVKDANGQWVNINTLSTYEMKCSTDGTFSFLIPNASSFNFGGKLHLRGFSQSAYTEESSVKIALVGGVTIDSGLPMITLLNQNAYRITGSCPSVFGSFTLQIGEGDPFKVSCPSSSSWEIRPNLSALSDGTKTISATLEGTLTSATVEKDSTAPSAPVMVISGSDVLNNRLSNSASVTLNFTSLSNGDLLKVYKDSLCASKVAETSVSGSTANVTINNSSATHLVEGSNRFYSMVTDQNGNQSSCYTHSGVFNLDTTPPALVMGNKPASTNNLTSVTVTVTGSSDTDTYSYKFVSSSLDTSVCGVGTGWSSELSLATNSSLTVPTLSDTNYVLCLRGKDLAGNEEPLGSTQRYSWLKDNNQPEVNVTLKFNSTTYTVPIFTPYKDLVAVIDGGNLQDYSAKTINFGSSCGSYGSWTSKTTNYSEMKPNVSQKYTLCVWGRTSSLTISSAPVTVDFYIDVTVPTAPTSVQVLGGVGTSYSSLTQSPPVAFVSSTDTHSGLDHYEAELVRASDNLVIASSSSFTSGSLLSGSLVGGESYKVRVKAIDKAGNISSWSYSNAWVADVTAPTLSGVQITNSDKDTTTPGFQTNELNINITATPSEPISKYIFLKYSSFAASCPAANHADYNENDGAKTSSNLPLTFSGLSDGEHKVCIVAMDSSGIKSTAPYESQWRVDTQGPTALVLSLRSGANLVDPLVSFYKSMTNSPYIHFSATDSGVGIKNYEVQIKLSSVEVNPYSIKTTGNQIALGGTPASGNSYTVKIKAYDKVGNSTEIATGSSWTIDSVVPEGLTLALKKTSANDTQDVTTFSSNTTTPYMHFTAVDSLSGVAKTEIEVKHSSGTLVRSFAQESTATQISGLTLSEGQTYKMSMQVTDLAGNVVSQGDLDTWTVDTTAPNVAVTGPADTLINAAEANAVVFSGSCSENGQSVNISLKYSSIEKGTSSAICTGGVFNASPMNLTNNSTFPQGAFTVEATTSDLAGNSKTSDVMSFTKDSIAPTIAISSPADTNFNISEINSVVFGGTCSENGRTVTVSLKYGGTQKGTTTATCTGGTFSATAINLSNNTTYPQGAFTVDATIADAAGNSATSALANYTKDTVVPTISVTLPVDTYVGAAEESAFVFGGTCSENGQAVTVSVKYGGTQKGTTNATCTGGSFSATAMDLSNDTTYPQGAFTVDATIADAAGNSATSALANYTKDTVAPTIAVTLPVDTFVNAAEDNAFVFGGSCSENGRTVTLSVKYGGNQKGTTTATCTGGSFSATAINLSNNTTYPQGAFTVDATIADAAGNSATSALANYTKDTVAPTIAVNLPADTYVGAAEESAFVFGGTCSENGQAVTVSVKYGGTQKGTTTATCTGGSFSATAMDLSNNTTYPQGAFTVDATIADAAGNSATSALANYTKDTVVPTIAVTLPVDTYVSAAEENAFVFGGTCSENGRTVTLSVKYGGTQKGTTTATCTGGSFSATAMDLSNDTTYPQGAFTVDATIADAAGNSATSALANYTKDTVAPAGNLTLISKPPNASDFSQANFATDPVDIQDDATTNTLVAKKYKYILSKNVACNTYVNSNWSAQPAYNILVGDEFTTDLISTNLTPAEGDYVYLCLISGDSLGNFQDASSVTQVYWKYDRTAPAITFSGAPSGRTADVTLDVTVNSVDAEYVGYRHKIVQGATCPVGSYPVSTTGKTTHITDSISALTDGSISICVLGVDSAGNIQSEVSATKVTFTLDRSATISLGANSINQTTRIVSVPVTLDGYITNLKYFVTAASGTSCPAGYNNGAYVGSTAVSGTSTTLNVDLNSNGPGNWDICIVGRDDVFNETSSYKSTVTVNPKFDLTLSGTPSGDDTKLNVTITRNAGDETTDYQFGFTDLASSCTGVVYGAARSIGTPLDDSIVHLASGSKTLCLRGIWVGSSTVNQTTPDQLTWTKNSITGHICYIDTADSNNVKCLGANAYGQSGAARATNPVTAANQVYESDGVTPLTATKLSIGPSHSCALSGGYAYCWGENGSGQLGYGSTTDSHLAQQVSTYPFKEIAVGNEFTCGIVGDGDTTNKDRVACWGKGSDYRLGQGTDAISNKTTPQLLKNNSSITSRTFKNLVAGYNFACAIGVNNDTDLIRCWGGNNFGQKGQGNTTSPVNGNRVTVNSPTTYSSISVNGYTLCGVKDSGLLETMCVGRNSSGEVGNPSYTTGNPIALTGSFVFSKISVGYNHTCGIISGTWNGTDYTTDTSNNDKVACWGSDQDGKAGTSGDQNQPTLTGASNYSDIYSSGTYSTKKSGGHLTIQGYLGVSSINDASAP